MAFACMQVYLYQHGLDLTRLQVLSTTTIVPTASFGDCPQGAINSICIGMAIMPLMHLYKRST
jgi:hypothetical protein